LIKLIIRTPLLQLPGGIDLHYPVKSDGFTGEAFRSIAETKVIDPYAVPYRCLYSRNINNLFMAGRNISVTHVALGTVRVQRTTGMMGEVVGMAASVCKKYDALPGDVYTTHLEELKKLMKEGVPERKLKLNPGQPAFLIGFDFI
jgi:hypothetical protein